MKPIAVFILLTVLALVAGPAVCVAGLGTHCPAEPHDHDEDGHGATPHASCLDDVHLQINKSAAADRPAPRGSVVPAPAAVVVSTAVSRLTDVYADSCEPPSCDSSFPLLN